MPPTLKRFFAILVLIVVHTTSNAQTTVDVVYLKNGSVIRGMIIEQVPNASLKIQTKDGSVFVYAIAEVERITKEDEKGATGARSTLRSPQPSEYVRSGYVNITSLGIGLGVGNYSGTVRSSSGRTTNLQDKNASNNYVRLETVNGLWLADGVVSLGLGVGLEYYMEPSNWNTNTIPSSHGQLPVFLDVRTIPVQGRLSPSFILQAGYSIGVIPAKVDLPAYSNLVGDRIFMNGLEVAAGVGLHTEVSSSVVFNVNVMYDYQQLLYESAVIFTRYSDGDLIETWLENYDYDTRFGALRISLGLAF